MRFRHVPRIDARYWIAITLASVLGANLGDFSSHVLGLGHVRGLPVLAVVFVAIVLAERTARIATEAFYWAAIVTLRTAATNLADLATHDLKLGYVPFILVLAALLLAMVAALARRPGPLPDDGRPDAGGLYWLTMLVAGTLGTALGDVTADQAGLVPAALCWSVIWAATLSGMVRRAGQGVGRYWMTIVVVRTVGTNAADLIAGQDGLALGLPVGTSVSAACLVVVLLAWPGTHRLPAAAGS